LNMLCLFTMTLVSALERVMYFSEGAV